MIGCRTARDLLLEADPAALRGQGDGELAAHLRSCAPCRAAAQAVLAGQAELDAALRTLAAPRRGTRMIPLRRRMPLVRRVAAVAVPLAAAAAAVLLVARPPATTAEKPGVQAERIARALFPRQPVAQPRPGQHAAVMTTRDPGVTVVWIY
jgi:hypothetical protein